MNQEPIRILHVIGSMNRGGAETMIMNLYQHINRTKVQFDFVENSFEPAAFDETILALGGRIYRCPHYNGKNHFQYVKWWNEFFKKHASDYVAVHGHLGSTAAIYLKIAKKFGVFAIAHSHNTKGKSLKDYIYSIYSYPTRFIADYFFACSNDAGVSRYGKKVCTDKSKFKVLNNAIDTKRFQYNLDIRIKIREQLGINNAIVLGHIGRFTAQKNHDFLIDVFEKVHKKNQNAVLILVGDGELRDKIYEKVKKMNLLDVVIFLGVQEDVSVYYQAMDLFLLPSLYEGLGIVAVEAQSTGLHCIISDKVSKECIVTEKQVAMCSLSSTAEKWANEVLDQVHYCRTDGSTQVIAHGYDIKESSEWLTKFYLSKVK